MLETQRNVCIFYMYNWIVKSKMHRKQNFNTLRNKICHKIYHLRYICHNSSQSPTPIHPYAHLSGMKDSGSDQMSGSWWREYTGTATMLPRFSGIFPSVVSAEQTRTSLEVVKGVCMKIIFLIF